MRFGPKESPFTHSFFVAPIDMEFTLGLDFMEKGGAIIDLFSIGCIS